MKKFLAATAATALLAGTAFADGHSSEIKIGVILGPVDIRDSHFV